MTEDAIFKEQWNLLKKEMAMGDAHLQQRLEQFIFRQYGRAVLTHYIKALSVLELSRHFYLRFRRRSRAVTEPILYWTVLTETTIHMTLEGVKDMHPFISLPARAGATFQLDMLKDCYLLYLRDRGYPCWPRASRRSRIIRNKWNAPELEAAYFLRLCQNSTDRHYANVMNILLEEILHMLITLRQLRNHGKNLLELRRSRNSNSSPGGVPPPSLRPQHPPEDSL